MILRQIMILRRQVWAPSPRDLKLVGLYSSPNLIIADEFLTHYLGK